MKSIHKKLIIVLFIAVGCLLSYSIWAYNNPKCSFVKAIPQLNDEMEENVFYFEQCRITFQSRLPFYKKLPVSFTEKLKKISDEFEKEETKVFQKYTSPTSIKVFVEIEDGKTIVNYFGTATDLSTNRIVSVNDKIIFDFIITKDIPY